MAAFTTWSALYQTMLNDMASGSWKTSEYALPNRSVKYRSWAEFRDALEYVKHQAEVETGDVVARTYARPRS
jgi:hypothetical protein